MSDARLLIDIEVLEFLRALRTKDQSGLLKRFREIAAAPAQFADFTERDSAGRRVDVQFWDDFADRHVKILDVHLAD